MGIRCIAGFCGSLLLAVLGAPGAVVLSIRWALNLIKPRSLSFVIVPSGCGLRRVVSAESLGAGFSDQS